MNDSVKAIILAAGKGTRMKSSLPKVLHKILGKTLVERVLNSVLKTGCISETFVITGHKANDVKNFLKEIYREDQYIKAILQEPQLGTADAVFKAYDKLKDFEGTVLVLCGDTPLLTSETLSEFAQFHKNSGSAVTVMSAVFENPENYGRIIRKKTGEVLKIVEEKDANLEEKEVKEINAGVYCLEWQKLSSAFFEITNNNKQREYYLTDIVDWAVKKELKTSVFKIQNNYEIFGINSRKHLAEAAKVLNSLAIEKLMDEGVTFISPENTFVSPETEIGQDSIVYPGCVIEGENIFGKNCTVGPGTFIGGNVKTGDNVKIIQSKVSDSSIGMDSTVGPFAQLRNNVDIASGVRIGNFVEIKNSRINSSTNVSHLSYIGDSFLGENVNIGAGTITANYDPLTKIKSRTHIENKAKIGSNCVLIAPVTIEKNASVGAGSVITKDVPASSLALAREKQKIIENWVEKKIKKNTETVI